jgi:pyochelin biosynthetic protein PchC
LTAPTEASGTWIRRFHPLDDPVCRLVCLPHAGASAIAFYPLSRGLAERHGIEALVVQYPGRLDRGAEPCCEDVAAMAHAVAGELPEWTDRPLAVLGHSMGATVGFELARLMEAGPRAPFRLIVSGQRSPDLQSRAPVSAVASEELVWELARLGGTSAALLSDPELLRMVLPPLRGDYLALSRYRSHPEPLLNCPITALVGEQDPAVPVAALSGWARTTRGPFGTRVFHGGHFYLETRREQFLDEVAGRLEGDLADLIDSESSSANL